MSEDISRNSFRKTADFSLVRMQQGRLFSDADWNEQGDILRAATREDAATVIGRVGFPEEDPGFGLAFDDATRGMLIQPGIGYVAGVRHVVRPPVDLRLQRISGNGANTVWQIDGPGVLEEGDTLSADGNAVQSFHRVTELVENDEGERRFRASPALPAAADSARLHITLSHQPYGPGVPTLPEGDDRYLFWLASTDLPVTALDDSTLREIAFDGPDTATRDRTVWQVGLSSFTELAALGYTDADLDCDPLRRAFDPTGRGSAPTLRVRAELPEASAGPCTLPPAAGYRSLDNLLYRIEIHAGGTADSALYKWSSENAIHRTRYQAIEAQSLILQSVGRDEPSALKTEDWVEIRTTDEVRTRAPGFFARLGAIVGLHVAIAELRAPDLSLVEVAGEPDLSRLAGSGFVTRWEGGLPTPVGDGLVDWVELSNGVQVNFGAGRFGPGQFWTVPGRSVSGDVDWPVESGTGLPMHLPPQGPRLDYAALAIFQKDGDAWSLVDDCRPLFPPLHDLLMVTPAGGDGQEAMPDTLAPSARILLAEPLRVAVTRGSRPVEGEHVVFEVTLGDGRVGGQEARTVVTGADGIAAVDWELDGRTVVQQVTATRRGDPPEPTHAPIVFNANLSRAANVSFDPTDTPSLAGVANVQDAIEALVGQHQVGCTTYIITPEHDWEAVLRGLAANENASVCFARGEYRATRTVDISGLGHINIYGAGPGVARILVDRAEAALAFTDCDAVSIRDLSISAPAGSSGITREAATGRRGTVDFSHCDAVEVRGCDLQCGAGTSPGRACLSVRGWTRELGSRRPTRSVRVHDNDFTVGHMQEAVVISDAVDVNVSGNRLAVRSRVRLRLDFSDFLSDRVWVAARATDLVARPVVGRAVVRGTGKQIRFREWRLEFESPVAQENWDALVRATPPAEADLASASAFESYGARIIDGASANVDGLPAIRRQIMGLAESLGFNQDRFSEPAVLRNLLVTSDRRTFRFDETSGRSRRVLLEANGQVVSFDSPVSQSDWNRALTRSGSGRDVANGGQLLNVANAIARRMVLDERFRSGFGSAENWFTGLRVNSPTLMKQGIVCGGRDLETVSITHNHIRDCQVAVRVATSHSDGARYEAGSVVIDENRMEFMTPTAQSYAGYGVFVGNARSIRIRGNDMSLSRRPNFRNFFAQGIRIWGFPGRHVLISENRIAMATLGIRLKHVEDNLASVNAYLWVVRHNLIEGPKGTRALLTTPPEVPVADSNRTFSGL